VKINRISIIDEMNLFLPSGVLSLSRITRVRGFRSRWKEKIINITN